MLKDHRLIRTPQQLLIDAEKKIAELERVIEKQKKDIEERSMTIARFMLMLEALDEHYNIGGYEKAKPIFDAYVEKEDARLAKALEDAKANFAEKVKSGEIEIVERDESLRKPDSN